MKAESVTSAYAGKAGKCCCGCSGKHYHRDGGTANDLKQINRIAAKIQELATAPSFTRGVTYASAEEDGRVYIVYFAN
jgi:hypothetical protein